jgi:tetratricopeptide (TPR) repeat protein
VRKTRDLPVWIVAVVLIAAGSWTWSNSLSGALAPDDVDAIARNPSLRSLQPVRDALWAPPDTTLAGRPVANLSFALNYAFSPVDARHAWEPSDPAFARNIRGYHLTNLAIHLAAGLVLVGVIRRTLLSTRLREAFGRHATALAGGITLLWLVHPVQTASVTYLVQRAESLMGLCYLLTVYAAIRASAPTPRRAWWIAMAVVACALGMGTKETMVSAPIVVALWYWLFGASHDGRIAWRLVPALAGTWVLLAALVMTGARTESVGLDLGGWTPLSYLRTQAEVVMHYMKLVVWPARLVFSYDWPMAMTWASVWPQGAVLGAVCLVGGWAALTRRPWAWPIAWWFLILAPSSSVLPIVTEVAAEHRMYLPLAAPLACVVLLIHRGVSRYAASWTGVVWVLVAASAVPLATMSHARNQVYESRERLWLDTVTKRPGHVRAEIGLGGEYLARGAYAMAERHLGRARSLPGFADVPADVRATTWYALGASIAAQGRVPEAIAVVERSFAEGVELPEAFSILGQAYLDTGRTREGVAMLERALDRSPDDVAVLNLLAWTLATHADAGLRNGARAVTLAERARVLTGDADPLVLDTLAAAFAEVGRVADAATTARRAVSLATARGLGPLAADIDTRRQAYEARLRSGR